MKKLKLISLALILMVCGAALTACAKEQVTVTFVTGTQEVASPVPQRVTVGKAIGRLPVLTRDSYSFDGWWTAKTGGTQIVATTKVINTWDYEVYARWTDIRTDPSFTVPTGLTAAFGQTLSQITLPSGWTWAAPGSTAVGNAGEQTHSAIFTPVDLINYNTVTRTITVTVMKATPVIIKEPTASAISYGSALSSSALSDGRASISGTFTWYNDTIVPPIDNDGYLVVFTPTGSYTDNYNTVTINIDVTVNKAAQAALTVDLVAGKTFGDEPFQISATGGTGTGAVTFTLVRGPATITPNGLVTITGAGSIVVTATKAGDDNYSAKTSVSYTITVAKANQAQLTINAVEGKTFGDTPFQLGTTGGTGTGAVSYEIISGPATVTSGGLVTLTGGGGIIVRATKASDANYNVINTDLTIIVNGVQLEAPTNVRLGIGRGYSDDSLQYSLDDEYALVWDMNYAMMMYQVYDIYVNDVLVLSTDTESIITNFCKQFMSNSGSYKIQIKARSTSDNYSDSELTTVNYTVGQMDVPTGLAFGVTGPTNISWNMMNNSSGNPNCYQIKTGDTIRQCGTSTDAVQSIEIFSSAPTPASLYNIQVRTVGKIDGFVILYGSAWCTPLVLDARQADTPTNFVFMPETRVFSWQGMATPLANSATRFQIQMIGVGNSNSYYFSTSATQFSIRDELNILNIAPGTYQVFVTELCGTAGGQLYFTSEAATITIVLT